VTQLERRRNSTSNLNSRRERGYNCNIRIVSRNILSRRPQTVFNARPVYLTRGTRNGTLSGMKTKRVRARATTIARFRAPERVRNNYDDDYRGTVWEIRWALKNKNLERFKTIGPSPPPR